MPKRLLFLVIALAVVMGCSQAALDRAKHFFFEVPEPSAQTDAQVVGPGAEPPAELVLPEPQFASVHQPVVEQRCHTCHATSGSMDVRENLADACRQCHPSFFGEAIEHSPVAEGQCLQCHKPHRSEHPSLLTLPGGQVCLECHDGPADLSEEAHGQPGADDCTRCHDPHFGSPMFLKPDRPTPAVQTD